MELVGPQKAPLFHPEACVGCGLCEEACPETAQAIRIVPLEERAVSREPLSRAWFDGGGPGEISSRWPRSPLVVAGAVGLALPGPRPDADEPPERNLPLLPDALRRRNDAEGRSADQGRRRSPARRRAASSASTATRCASWCTATSGCATRWCGRGDAFHEVSWEEALGEVARRLEAVKHNYGARGAGHSDRVAAGAAPAGGLPPSLRPRLRQPQRGHGRQPLRGLGAHGPGPDRRHQVLARSPAG